MIGGISSDKTHTINVHDYEGNKLFEADINNDANAETIILTHPSNRYTDAILAGKYVIEKLDDNNYYINHVMDPSYRLDLERRLAELMN